MKKVRILFAGDFCSRPSASCISVSDDFKNMVRSCDLRVVNFEVPLKPEGSYSPQKVERLYQSDDVPQFLCDVGFNLFSIANNHIFDWGAPGFIKTKTALGNACFGAGNYNEAYRVKEVELDGLKIGFLALTYAAYTGVFDDVVNHDGYGCAYINDLKVNHVILEAKKTVDYLFVLAHDGIEYCDVPMPETIARYRDFIDYGADGVIGTHPHCPQGWEVYKGRPIFYSLGNLFFNSKEDTSYRAWNRPHWYEGLCVILEIENGIITYQTINVRNKDNVEMMIDDAASREAHNNCLLLYFADEEKYNKYLANILEQLNLQSIVDKTFHPNNLKSSAIMLCKCIGKKLIKKDFTDDFKLLMLLRNGTRLNALIRSLKGR